MTIIKSLDAAFAHAHARSQRLLELVSDKQLYLRSAHVQVTSTSSIADFIVRGAAEIEIMSGGITTRLWDDPFEWTLPEHLSTRERIVEYLAEVETARIKAFSFFSDDAELFRTIPAPRALRTIFDVLARTLVRSSHYIGGAYGVFTAISGLAAPRF